MSGHAGLSGGVAELILSAGPVAKFVLLVLVVFSIICWALIVEKWWGFRKIRRETGRFLRVFREARRLSVVYGAAKKHRDSPLAQVYAAGAQEAMGGFSLDGADRGPDEWEDGVPRERLDAMGRAMRRAATVEIERMERYLPFLATTASSAPFIGLFGTVWGVMTSFQGIGTQGSASLAVVAPGISEALIATAAGLAAAIPAVMGYNFFVNRVKYWAGEMDSFSLELLNLFGRSTPKPVRALKDGH